MTPTDRALSEIRKRICVRTPILAALLDMEDAEVDALLAEPLARGALVGCDVQLGDAKVKEYRFSASAGGEFVTFTPGRPPKRPEDPVKARLAEWRQPKPSTPEASAGVAPLAPSRPAAPRAVDSTKEEPMQGTVIERALAALKKHGQLSLDELAKHAGTTKSTLYTCTGTLVKMHGVRKVAGKRGTFEMGDQQPAPVKHSGQFAEKRNSASSGLAGALAELRKEREYLQAEIVKVDVAITAIEALG